MNGKELVKAILSRKFAIAIVGIFALCYIAKAQPGQLPIDENSVVRIVPMPKVPAAEQKSDWLTPTYITLITIVTVAAQATLDYFKQRDKDAIELHREPAEPEATPEGGD